jgi:hypothetical protein
VSLYIAPRDEARVVIPNHKCSAAFEFPDMHVRRYGLERQWLQSVLMQEP